MNDAWQRRARRPIRAGQSDAMPIRAPSPHRPAPIIVTSVSLVRTHACTAALSTCLGGEVAERDEAGDNELSIDLTAAARSLFDPLLALSSNSLRSINNVFFVYLKQ